MNNLFIASSIKKHLLILSIIGIMAGLLLLNNCSGIHPSDIDTSVLANQSESQDAYLTLPLSDTSISYGVETLNVRFTPAPNIFGIITYVNPGSYVQISADPSFCDFILYTTDGSTPGQSSTTQYGPYHIPSIYVPVKNYLVLKAKAVAQGVPNSPIKTGVYAVAIFHP